MKIGLAKLSGLFGKILLENCGWRHFYRALSINGMNEFSFRVG